MKARVLDLRNNLETGKYMKVRMETIDENEEEEIVLRTRVPDARLFELLRQITKGQEVLTGYHADGSMSKLDLRELYYFESVENRVFAYGKKDVTELKCRLYELEERFVGTDFIRISKSMILSLGKVERFVPMLGGRIEAVLKNGERAVISRQYVPEVKRRLGLYAQRKAEKNT